MPVFRVERNKLKSQNFKSTLELTARPARFMHSIAGCRRKSKKHFMPNTPVPSSSCEAAKRYFDSLGLKKQPSVQSLKQEYAALLAENKKLYPDQKKEKSEMMELLTVKYNTSRILGLTEEEKQREQRQEER